MRDKGEGAQRTREKGAEECSSSNEKGRVPGGTRETRRQRAAEHNPTALHRREPPRDETEAASRTISKALRAT